MRKGVQVALSLTQRASVFDRACEFGYEGTTACDGIIKGEQRVTEAVAARAAEHA